VVAINVKSEPFHAITAARLADTVTPVVGPAPTILTAWLVEVALMTRYTLLVAGTVTVSIPEGFPVHRIRAYCAEPVLPDPACVSEDPLVVESVTAVCEPLMTCAPATAESKYSVM
jgi:hypothetical protein